MATASSSATPPPGCPRAALPYDVILVNSLLHHLDDRAVTAALGSAASLLAPGGAIHILDLELPSDRGLARFLAEHDRGDHVRPRDSWLALLGGVLQIQTFEPYALRVAGKPLWNMFYVRATG